MSRMRLTLLLFAILPLAVNAACVEFESLSGNQLLQSWSYFGPDTPPPGTENLRVNLWLYGGTAPAGGQDAEIVITRFEYHPVNDNCRIVTCIHDTLDVPERHRD